MSIHLWCLALTGISLFVAGVIAFVRRRPGGADVIVSLVDGPWLESRPLRAGLLLWLGAAALGEVIFAGDAFRPYVGTRDGLLALVTFGIIVPWAVGAYFWLRMSQRTFFKPATLTTLGLRENHPAFGLPRGRVAFLVYQLAIIASALFIQNLAMTSEVCSGLPHSPWSSPRMAATSSSPDWWPVTCTRVLPPSTTPVVTSPPNMLTVRGVGHYVIRGLGAYLALNLILIIVVVSVRLLAGTVAHEAWRVFTREYKPRREVEQLGLALLVAVLLSALATTVEGLALFVASGKGLPFESSGDLLVALKTSLLENQEFLTVALESTWAFWALMSLVITVLGGLGIWKLQSLLKHGKKQLIEDWVSALDSQWHNPVTYWPALGGIHLVADKIDTSVVPALGKLVSSAIVLQILGFILRLAGARGE